MIKESRYISPDVRAGILKRDGHKCLACGHEENLEIDHVVPFSRGGGSDWGNLQTLCKRCNQAKFNYSSSDWRGNVGKSPPKQSKIYNSSHPCDDCGAYRRYRNSGECVECRRDESLAEYISSVERRAINFAYYR